VSQKKLASILIGMQIAPTGSVAGTGVSEAKLAPTTGQSGPVTGAGGPSPSTTTQQAVLNDTAVIRELAVADLLKLTQILQPATPPEQVVRVERLIEEIVRAITEDRREWAVGRFIEAATTDPSRVDELRSKPEFEAIRANVELLMNRLTNVAKMDAETKLSAAEQVLENAGWQKLPHWETAPEALIQIGHRLIEAGGYANYVRTAELATTLQTAYWSTAAMLPLPIIAAAPKLKKEDTRLKGKGAGAAAMALAHHSWDVLRERMAPQVGVLWQRAPLLVILGAWFTVGLVGGTISYLAKIVWPDSWIVPASNFGFQLWGIGFLAIVGFGFWARVKRPRR
jgi:hypothetical protein